MRNRLGLPLLAVTVAGCAAMDGMAPVIDRHGAVSKPASGAGVAAAGEASGTMAKINLAGPARAFFEDESASASARQNPDNANAMAQSGFALVRSNCIDYFDRAGASQKWLLFSRDTVAAVGTIAAGVLALRGGHANAAGTVALVTNATFSGMDIYTKNFLFAAENVSAVKELVIRALDTHSQAIDPANIRSYRDASDAVYDNQHYCSSMKIAALARDAIQRGVVVAKTASPDRADAEAALDEEIYEKLGALLNPPGALSVNQTVALWWLLKHDTTPLERTADILPKLQGIPAGKLPIDANGDPVPGFDRTRVVALLNGFSTATRASFRKQVEAAKSRVPAAGGTGPGSPFPVPRPPLGDFVQPRSAARTATSVSVGIQ